MTIRYLHVSILLLLAFPACIYAQSLGDVARQIRAERLAKATPRAKVFTNDDIATSEPAKAAANSPEETKSEPEAAAAKGAELQAEKPSDAKSDDTGKAPTKSRETQELKKEVTTQELNQRYLDRIATLRGQISAAQADLAKLQRLQMESNLAYQRSLGTAPTPGSYEQQQQVFNQQIEDQRTNISNLNSKLEDAQEAARHAGVPHAFD